MKNIADLQMTGDQLPNILEFHTTYMYVHCTYTLQLVYRMYVLDTIQDFFDFLAHTNLSATLATDQK